MKQIFTANDLEMLKYITTILEEGYFNMPVSSHLMLFLSFHYLNIARCLAFVSSMYTSRLAVLMFSRSYCSQNVSPFSSIH